MSDTTSNNSNSDKANSASTKSTEKNSSETISTKSKLKKSTKNKGPVRTEAVIPFLIVAILTYGYFAFFFDMNLRSALEFIGYEVIGAEVDIAKIETSFLHGSFRMQGVEITNPDKPNMDMVKIGDIRFALLWDGLLRARFVVDEMAVEKIEISVPRTHAGKVKPPPPPPAPLKPGEQSALEKEALKAGKQAMDVTKNKFQGNVLGDIAAVLGGGAGANSGDDQLKNIEQNLPSKQKLDAFSKELTEKQKKWEEKLKTLPQSKEIEALGQRISTVKTNNFKSPQEVVESLQKISEILKEADSKYKTVSSVATELNSDINSANSQFKEINELVNKDIANLQSHFHIPNIDGKSLSASILQQYLAPYLAKVNHYKSLANKYVPPNMMKKGEKEPDVSMKPHPRAKGVTYEFGRQNSYPLFWIKKISVSSKAVPSNKMLGDLSGQITDVTSNQLLTGHPTVGTLQGNFPGMNVSGVKGRFSFDNRHVDAVTDFDFSVDSYPIDGRDVMNSPDAKIAFKTATGTLKTHGDLTGLTQIDFSLSNQVSKIDYDISAPNALLNDILKNVFAGIPVVDIQAKGKGDLPDVALDVNSNIGPELQKGFEKQISHKIEEAKAKLQAAINQAIGGERSKVEAQLSQAKGQVDGQVKKIEEALNTQKAKAEKQSSQAQKGSQGDVQKKLDDLKKSLGF